MFFRNLSPDLGDEAFNLLCHMAKFRSKEFSNDFQNLLTTLIPFDPRKSLVLFQRYLAHEDHINPWPVFDIMIKEQTCLRIHQLIRYPRLRQHALSPD
jgi:hypothetical protein